MADFEDRIALWRRELSSGMEDRPEVVDELEDHLRQEIETLTRAGKTPGEGHAVQSVGSGGHLGALRAVASDDELAPAAGILKRSRGVDQGARGMTYADRPAVDDTTGHRLARMIEREARRVLLARLPTLEHARLGGHTGGNLLLSMMERYSGDFLAAVEGLQSLLGVAGHVWPVSVESASICAQYGDGSTTRGEVEVDAGQSAGHMISRLWLEPWVNIHPAAAQAISQFDAAVIGPGSFYTSLMPIFLVRGAPEAIQQVKGPVVLVCNLLTEGRGMWHFTAGEAVREMAALIGRPIDVVLINTSRPSEEILGRYGEEHKRPLAVGDVPEGCEVVTGDFWRGGIARHDRRRLAHAIWAVLARRLL